jgi:molecular chaperone DnaJ
MSGAMSKRCYYETLECQTGATVETLKASYRKLAMKFHPDKNPGDASAEVHFKEINEAYDVLKDDQKRAAYDRFGHAAFESGMGGRPGGGPFDFTGSFSDVFEDFFGDLMGGRKTRRGNRGQDLRYNLQISLEEAYRGRNAEIQVPTAKPAMARARKPATMPRPAPPAPGTARCAPPRAFSPSSAAVRPAAAAARSSAILARSVVARARCRRSAF